MNDNLTEAFIIGVDELAKERLNNLTRENKVTPIDLRELSEELNTPFRDTNESQIEPEPFLDIDQEALNKRDYGFLNVNPEIPKQQSGQESDKENTNETPSPLFLPKLQDYPLVPIIKPHHNFAAHSNELGKKIHFSSEFISGKNLEIFLHIIARYFLL